MVGRQHCNVEDFSRGKCPGPVRALMSRDGESLQAGRPDSRDQNGNVTGNLCNISYKNLNIPFS
jgi:hypothetical protein